MVVPKNIVVLMGGWSAEREVSLSSATEIIKTLTSMGHHVRPIDLKDDPQELIASLTPRPDVVFNGLYGTGGEDGAIQGFLDILKIPYTHSGVMASAVGMNKVLSRKLFEYARIPTPPWAIVNRHSLAEKTPFPTPYVIKPLKEGSSRGVFIIESVIPQAVIGEDWAFGDEILVEKYIKGREIQVGVMGDRALGAIEIQPKVSFYDYQAKYTDGFAKHLMPAPLTREEYEKVLEYALRAHILLECRGVSRSDFIYDGNTFHLLELNTQPGMTPLSLFPEIAAHQGISFADILGHLIHTASYRT